MNRFASGRDAKEFLVARIVAEAQREGVLLSEIERKMLYFSETDRTLPDIDKVSEAFASQYDHDEYEKKITGLTHHARTRARKEDKPEFEAWAEAIRLLSKEDHYLLVMINDNGTSVDLLGLGGIGLLILVMVAAPILLSKKLTLVLPRFGIKPTPESFGFSVWLIAATIAVVGTLLYYFPGLKRATVLLGRVTGKLLGFFQRRA